jgi:hypothetical protein
MALHNISGSRLAVAARQLLAVSTRPQSNILRRLPYNWEVTTLGGNVW